jgi:hypothetical protein
MSWREMAAEEWSRQEPLVVWAPVWLGAGIGAYFALTAEPPAAAAWAALAGAALLALAAWRWPAGRGPLVAVRRDLQEPATTP